jgi:hypothetical protein
MNQGWVYVFVNSSLPGYAKVGRTHRSPAQRAAELSAATGVPTPFVLAFEQAFDDCVVAERLVHAELDRRGLRVAQNREFFIAPPSDIIRIILDLTDRIEPATQAADDTSADRLCAAALCALHGTGNHLQDTGEAVRLFKLAVARGSLAAYERVGQIYAALYLANQDRPRKRRAMAAYKEGARRGNYYCYAGMADIFAAERHAGNFSKAWTLFLKHRAEAFRPELERDASHYARALARYIEQACGLGVQPEHLAELRAATASIMTVLLNSLDTAKDDLAARQRITATLRWAYENLLPPPEPVTLGRRILDQLAPRWVSSPKPRLA